MADISTPLKQFTDAVLAQEAMARKRELVEQKGAALKLFSSRLSRTANIVASANARTKRRSEGLVHLSSQVRYRMFLTFSCFSFSSSSAPATVNIYASFSSSFLLFYIFFKFFFFFFIFLSFFFFFFLVCVFLLLLLLSSAPLQVQNLTPQLVNAGTIKMTYPENKAADENFENLRKQYAAGVQTIRDFCDESIDIATFLRQTEEHIRRSVATCEEGVATKHSQVQTATCTLHLETCTWNIYMNL